jgi:hypothetical protein
MSDDVPLSKGDSVCLARRRRFGLREGASRQGCAGPSVSEFPRDERGARRADWLPATRLASRVVPRAAESVGGIFAETLVQPYLA